MGLYHTAGKGTRLAPMPGSENNNKPGVKLAVTADINGKPSPLTILESVVKQTGVYGKSRKGRLSVFWGDQVTVCTFFPLLPRIHLMNTFPLLYVCMYVYLLWRNRCSHPPMVNMLTRIPPVRQVTHPFFFLYKLL